MDSRGKGLILRGDAYGWLTKMERVADNEMLQSNYVGHEGWPLCLFLWWDLFSQKSESLIWAEFRAALIEVYLLHDAESL
jgi:hypothetical protein